MGKVCLQQVLKRELKNKGLTSHALAVKCGIPASVLHSWINGVLPSAKNLHYVQALSEYLKIPVSVLLFNKRDDQTNDSVLFSSEFADGDMKYRILVEKVKR